MISGDTNGTVWVFLRTGSKEKPKLAEGYQVKAARKTITDETNIYKNVDGKRVVDKTIPANHELAGPYSKLHYADWDGDGLDDLLIGQLNNIVFYKNVGSRSKPEFIDPVEIKNADGKFPDRSSPYVFDWDGDGKNDMVIGTEKGTLFFYRNTGKAGSPKLGNAEEIKLEPEVFYNGYRHRIEITDWNNDGKIDLLVGDRYFNRSDGSNDNGGNIWLFLGK
ncbi:FG-GAP repeat domain-containing protein [candidate division KSB1 bacterium]